MDAAPLLKECVRILWPSRTPASLSFRIRFSAAPVKGAPSLILKAGWSASQPLVCFSHFLKALTGHSLVSVWKTSIITALSSLASLGALTLTCRVSLPASSPSLTRHRSLLSSVKAGSKQAADFAMSSPPLNPPWNIRVHTTHTVSLSTTCTSHSRSLIFIKASMSGVTGCLSCGLLPRSLSPASICFLPSRIMFTNSVLSFGSSIPLMMCNFLMPAKYPLIVAALFFLMYANQ